MKRSEMIVGGATVVAAIVAILAYVNDLQGDNPAPAPTPTIQPAPSLLPPSPSPTLTPSLEEEPPPAPQTDGPPDREPAELEKVEVVLRGSYGKVGTSTYQLGRWDQSVTIGYLWTASTNYGELPNTPNCDVVGKAIRKSDGEKVGDTGLSAECSAFNLLGVTLVPGDYTINVQVAYDGKTVTGSTDVTVLPSSG